jgi:hypoxanthine phosphoribosyltransferase
MPPVLHTCQHPEGARVIDPDGLVHETLLEEKAIQERIRELAGEITRDYADREPLVVCVLKGGFIFLADLVRHLDFPLAVDFMAISSYGAGTHSSGVVRILKDLETPIEDRDVLVVEDIVDSGLTLHYLMRNLQSRRPKSLEVCALLTKPARREIEVPIRYVGFEIPDRFVVGYGLDHAERYRNLRDIGVVDVSRLED